MESVKQIFGPRGSYVSHGAPLTIFHDFDKMLGKKIVNQRVSYGHYRLPLTIKKKVDIICGKFVISF